VALGASDRGLARLRLPRRWIVWLRSAVAEEVELESAIRPAPGRWPDAAIAAGSLVVVVAASVTMERAASALGNHFAIPEIVVGGLVLAAVTSLPNVVAAVYLAARGRGAATLSTALNSNRGLPLIRAGFHSFTRRSQCRCKRRSEGARSPRR
jgi:mitochondrial fission protein ELM1